MKRFPAPTPRHLILAVTLSAFSASGLASGGTLHGFEDPGVPMLFFWNGQGELTGVVINVAAPSQETEGLSEVSADFWHEVRQEVRKRHRSDWFIFPQCAASGDISPHLMFRKRAEKIMLERKGISSRQEIALRLADALDAVLPYCKSGTKRKLQSPPADTAPTGSWSAPKEETCWWRTF